jgi:putative DNA primase/helicase
MAAAGVGAFQIPTDGAIYRWRGPDDKPGRENCWGVRYGEHAAVFGSWRLGFSEVWRNSTGRLSKDDRAKLAGRIKETQAKAAAEQKKRHETAAEKAQRLWKATQSITDPKLQPYLCRKQIGAHSARRLGGAIVVPAYDPTDGRLRSLQFIRQDGSKRFLEGGRIAGAYYPLADEPVKDHPPCLAVAEGFATAATIHEISKIPVAIAFNAGNLLAVARTLRKKYPRTGLVICADNDRCTYGNPGVTKATEAARAVHGVVLIPEFPDDVEGSDFNDLAAVVGEEVVGEQLTPAIEAARAQLSRPVISVTDAHMPSMVDDAEKPLLARHESLRIFERNGEIVRIVNPSGEEAERVKKRDNVEREPGTLILHSMSTIALMDVFDQLIYFEKETEEGQRQAECPKRLAETYIARVGFRRLPQLAGIIEAPILLPDGTLLTRPGYHRDSGLYLNSNEDWTVPKKPSLAEAQAAANKLLAPFSQFPFVSPADRAVLLAAILTALQRRLLDHAPLIAFSAPAQRTGKSKLAHAVSILATGRKAAAMAVAEKDEEELHKAITSILRDGLLVTVLDNIRDGYPFDSAELAKAITEPTFRDRLFFTQTTINSPTNIQWIATGNHITFKGDLTSRSLVSMLDAECEHPGRARIRHQRLRSVPAQKPARAGHCGTHHIGCVRTRRTAKTGCQKLGRL